MFSRRTSLFFLILFNFSFAWGMYPFLKQVSRDTKLFALAMTIGSCSEYVFSRTGGSFSPVVHQLAQLAKNKMETNDRDPLAGWAHQAYLDNLNIAARDTHRVPSELGDLDDFEFHHLKSPYQKGPSCAWYSVCNAKVIQTLLEAKKPLSVRAIKKLVCDQYIPQLKRDRKQVDSLIPGVQFLHGLSIEKTGVLANYMGLKNHCLLYLYDNHAAAIKGGALYHDLIQKTVKAQLDSDAMNYVTHFKKLVKTIKGNLGPVVHIIVSLPSTKECNHAVLFTMIHRGPFRKPLLLYMNSNNTKLSLAKNHSVQKEQDAVTVQNTHIEKLVTSLETYKVK